MAQFSPFRLFRNFAQHSHLRLSFRKSLLMHSATTKFALIKRNRIFTKKFHFEKLNEKQFKRSRSSCITRLANVFSLHRRHKLDKSISLTNHFFALLESFSLRYSKNRHRSQNKLFSKTIFFKEHFHLYFSFI